ncbi:hypothetical protein CALCODRAFT_488128 [Calocera cornea HHB12733]|uniref:Uncharacterized protein n=1 Tax=Calocera cornea HHB12733 TaxID=1353952 RepID=A0A165CQ77_9BASI|nr:hypothetical protein CALCODRAFT_488128 [Calocera cornea HHB12733]
MRSATYIVLASLLASSALAAPTAFTQRSAPESEVFSSLRAARDSIDNWDHMEPRSRLRKVGTALKVAGDMASAAGDINTTGVEDWFHRYLRRDFDEKDKEFDAYARARSTTNYEDDLEKRQLSDATGFESELDGRGILGLIGKGAEKIIGAAAHSSGGGNSSSGSSGIGGFLSSIFTRDLEERSKSSKSSKGRWSDIGTGLSAAGTAAGLLSNISTTSVGDWFEDHLRRDKVEAETDLDERGILGLIGKGAEKIIGAATHSSGGGNSSSSTVGSIISSIFKRDLEELDYPLPRGFEDDEFDLYSRRMEQDGSDLDERDDIGAEASDLYDRELLEDDGELKDRQLRGLISLFTGIGRMAGGAAQGASAGAKAVKAATKMAKGEAKHPADSSTNTTSQPVFIPSVEMRDLEERVVRNIRFGTAKLPPGLHNGSRNSTIIIPQIHTGETLA